MRVASFNVNGIRAASRRGFDQWLAVRACDVVALQEVRCPGDLIPPDAVQGYHLTYDAGEIPGRNGVGVLSRVPPVAIRRGFGNRTFDREGRYLEVDLDLPGGRLVTVGSVYLPKGATQHGREANPAKYRRKMAFLASFGAYLTRARRVATRSGRQFLVMGDFNVAHTRQDLRAWRTNQRSAGFLPEERAWIGAQLGPRRLVDVVRRLHADADGPYTWWSWLGQSWRNDSGWRIDYHLATPALAASAVTGGTDKAASYEERMSDHAPVVVDYDW